MTMLPVQLRKPLGSWLSAAFARAATGGRNAVAVLTAAIAWGSLLIWGDAMYAKEPDGTSRTQTLEPTYEPLKGVALSDAAQLADTGLANDAATSATPPAARTVPPARMVADIPRESCAVCADDAERLESLSISRYWE